MSIQRFTLTFILGINLSSVSQASTLLPISDECPLYSQGLRPSSEKSKQALTISDLHHLKVHGLKAIPLEESPLPTSYDLSQYAVILKQDTLGSCTSNSAAQCIRVIKTQQLMKLDPSLTLEQAKSKINTPSRLYHYYYERKYMSLDGHDYTQEDSGASIADSLWVLHNKGIPGEIYWPYNISNYRKQPPASADEHAKDNQDIGDLHSEEIMAGDILMLKRALSQGVPVSGGIQIFASFNSPVVKQSGYVPVPNIHSEKLMGGHAITFLGYDDNDKTNGYSGHFLLANSWGTQWGLPSHGQRGFFKLPYEYVQNTNLTSELWKVASMSMNDIIVDKKLNSVSTPAVAINENAQNVKTLSAIFQADLNNLLSNSDTFSLIRIEIVKIQKKFDALTRIISNFS